MEEIKATLSRRSRPATERVIIYISWQIRMPRREPKSVVKTKIACAQPRESSFWSRRPPPPNGINIDGLGFMSLDGHKHQTDGIAKLDLTHKSDLWFWWQPRLSSSLWRWQPPALEPSSASAPADRKKSVCADAGETATQVVFLISNQEEKLLSMGDWMPCF